MSAQASINPAIEARHSDRAIPAPYVRHIRDMVERRGIKSILDYGCGLKDPIDFGAPVTRYDLRAAQLVHPQQKFDLVICHHVLCNVGRRNILMVAEQVFRMAAKAVFISEHVSDETGDVFRNRGASLRDISEAQWIGLLCRQTPTEAILATSRADGAGYLRLNWLNG